MKHRSTIARIDWASLFLVMLCVASYGCKDSVSVSEKPDVPLASLRVTPATLQPSFSSDTTSYTAEAPTSSTSVTVTATPQASTVTVSIDGTVATEHSIMLGQPGSTKRIPIVLTTQTGTETTYVVRVIRLLSSDNNLKSLTITPGSLTQSFDATTLDYTVDVATDVTSVTVTATKSDPEAVISGTLPNEGVATIQLDGPGTTKTVSITVTAPNQTSKTYRITVRRAASNNNNLTTLRIQAGTVDQPLSPTFSSGQIRYSVEVGTKVPAITVTATKADPQAVLSGDLPNEGQATIQLDGPGTHKVVSIRVTAQDGSIKTYTVLVNRAAPSSNNNLSALSVTSGSLSPPFAPGELTYTVDVPTTVTSVDVAATKADPDAVMSGAVSAGVGQASGQASVLLGMPGTATRVSVTITAPDGTPKTYTMSITRRASSDSTLSALSVSTGSLEPVFAPDTVRYTVNVGFLFGSVIITATKTDPNSIMSSLGSVIAAEGTQTGTVTVSPGLGPNPPVEIVVTAQDRIKTTTYTVIVTRRIF